MKSRLRYGIIGYGRFAERTIAPAIKNSAYGEVIALQKRSLKEAQAKAHEAKIPLAFGSVEELVRSPEIDAVFIVSANSGHAPEAIAAAEAGKHVLVEKPMSLTVAEGERMIAACRKNNVLLSVGHMVRLSPAVRRVRELVASGKFGPVTFARADFCYDARQSHRHWLVDTAVAGGGPLYDIGVHCLDTLRYVLDDEITSVRAHLSPVPTSVRTESTANLSLRFSRGTLGSVFCSYEYSGRRRILEIVCLDAVITVPDFTASGEPFVVNVVQGNGDSPDERTSQTFPAANLYTAEVDLFSRSILSDKPVELSGENGLQDMRVLEAAMNAARQN